MNGKHYFFKHVVKSNLTGEQLRVLMCMLTAEMDGVIGIKQREICDMLNLAESNVSRSIKALTEAGLLSKTEEKGFDGRPIWNIDPIFDKQAREHAERMYVEREKPAVPIMANDSLSQLQKDFGNSDPQTVLDDFAH
jgi:predicted transcriptional regulator